MATLSDAEVQERLAGLGEWRLENGAIVRDLKVADFAAAMALAQRVGDAAEAANHHPDILVHGWNKVRLTLMTHSEGGLTEADLRLAGQIDELV
jgi:4a-hydroxytetrahydrobiopterin dehydratase